MADRLGVAVVAVVRGRHGIGAEDVEAAEAVGHTRVGGVVSIGHRVGHIGVASVVCIHEEASGVTRDRLDHSVSSAAGVEVDRAVGRGRE